MAGCYDCEVQVQDNGGVTPEAEHSPRVLSENALLSVSPPYEGHGWRNPGMRLWNDQRDHPHSLIILSLC
jgi:hypothetical protein